MKKTSKFFMAPYIIWILLFVLAPVLLIVYQSFFNIHDEWTLVNYQTYFNSPNMTYLKMSFNSIFYAGIITLVTLLISYPTAFLLTQLKHKQLWLMLIILPTWVNLLLKAYAFYWNLWSAWLHQSIFVFLWHRSSADSLYRLFFHCCCQLH